MSDTPVVGLDPMQLGTLVHQYEEQITLLKNLNRLERAHHERLTHERDLWRAIAVRLLATATGLDTATVFTQFPTPPIEITEGIPPESAISNALFKWWADLSMKVTNASGKDE